MSNNIYDILKKIESLEVPKKTLNESSHMTKKKEEKKNESKTKDKADKGAIAEAVAKVESQLNEKYMGFKKLEKSIAARGDVEDPGAVAASIGRKKYGKAKFQKAAAAGKKLGEAGQQLPSPPDEVHLPKPGSKHGPVDVYRKKTNEAEVEESGLQAYLGKKKYGETGMKALQQAGREGASKEKMAMIRAKHDKMDEGSSDSDQMSKDPYGQYQKNLKPGKTIGSTIATGAKNIKRKAEKYVANKLGQNLERGPLDEHNYTEDMLSPAQKKFAALAEPKDKITYADKIAGAKKDKKTEGNKFSGNLMKARAQGLKQADLDGDGDMEPVREETGEERDAAARRENERYDSARNYQGRNARGDVIRSGGEVVRGNPTPPSLMQRVAGSLGLPNTAKDALGEPLYKSSRPAGGDGGGRGGGGGGRAGGMGGHITDPGAVKSLIPNFESKTSMREGWEEMQKYLEKKRGPESKGGAGKKAGTRYGGAAQKDDAEDIDGEGQPAVKKKGRPKGTGGGAKFNFNLPKD